MKKIHYIKIILTLTLMITFFGCAKKESKITIKDIELFPSIESVFESDIDKCREVLFPICTIRLGSIKKEWGNEKIHLILYNEDPYNTERAKHFNEFCKDYMIGFDVIKGKYIFKTDFGYFDLREDWKQWFDKTKESYEKSKKDYEISGKGFGKDTFQLGGKPNWWQSDETPLDPDGKPMVFITEFDYDGVKFFLFYSHIHKLAVQICQID